MQEQVEELLLLIDGGVVAEVTPVVLGGSETRSENALYFLSKY